MVGSPGTALAFDTSTSIGVVAVIGAEGLLAERTWNRDNSHGELLTPAIQETLQESGVTLQQITRLIVGVGPGSFTGARISVNVARALSFSLNLPVYPIDTFELIAASTPQQRQPLLVALRGQKNSIFASTFVWKYDRWAHAQAIGSIAMSDLGQHLDLSLTPYVGVGNAFSGIELAESIKSKILRVAGLNDEAQSSAFLILNRQTELDQRPSSDWKTVQALYLRSSSAEERRDEGLGTRGS